jgi:hypothetical protein
MKTKDRVALRPVGVGDAKLRSGISVVICPKCTREVVSKNGVIQPHADMKKGGWCGGAKAKDSSVARPLAALALLLWLVHRFAGPTDAERAAESNWDLTKYRPAPREW